MDIPEFKQIYRLFWQRIPTSEIAGHVGLSESTVGRVVRFLKSASHQVSLGDDAAIATLFHQYQPSRQARRNLCVPDWETIMLRNKRDRKVPLSVLHEEYAAAVPTDQATMSYKSFCRNYNQYLKGLPPDLKDLSMTMTWPPGEVAQIDYSGDGVYYKDRKTGELRKAEIFVGVLANSGLAFCYATPRQTRDDWLDACTKMLSYFGGVPRYILLDNSTSLVSKAHRYNPTCAKEFIQFCDHYQTTPLPVRPGSPRDKALVEGLVGIIQTHILNPMLDLQFVGLEDVNRELRKRLDSFNERGLTDKNRISRRSCYESEKPFLTPLPEQEFEPSCTVKVLKVRRDYQIRLGNKRVSVPYQYVGKKIKVIIYPRKNLLEGFDLQTGERIAQHYLTSDGSAQIKREHMPKSHAAVAMTVTELIENLASSGEKSKELASRIMMRSPGLVGKKLLSGLLAKRKALGFELFEECCKKTLARPEPSYEAFLTVADELTGYTVKRTPLRAGTTLETDQKPIKKNIRGAGYMANEQKRRPSRKQNKENEA